MSVSHLSSAGTRPPAPQHARNTWLPEHTTNPESMSFTRLTCVCLMMCVCVPQTGLRSSRGCEPCCPARSCGVQACWRKIWPDCTAGPPASPGLARAPSSAPWPSEPSGSSTSGPSRRTGTLCSAGKSGSHKHTYVCKHLRSKA